MHGQLNKRGSNNSHETKKSCQNFHITILCLKKLELIIKSIKQISWKSYKMSGQLTIHINPANDIKIFEG